jgi:hypothetical protein
MRFIQVRWKIWCLSRHDNDYNDDDDDDDNDDDELDNGDDDDR